MTRNNTRDLPDDNRWDWSSYLVVALIVGIAAVLFMEFWLVHPVG